MSFLSQLRECKQWGQQVKHAWNEGGNSGHSTALAYISDYTAIRALKVAKPCAPKVARQKEKMQRKKDTPVV